MPPTRPPVTRDGLQRVLDLIDDRQSFGDNVLLMLSIHIGRVFPLDLINMIPGRGKHEFHLLTCHTLCHYEFHIENDYIILRSSRHICTETPCTVHTSNFKRVLNDTIDEYTKLCDESSIQISLDEKQLIDVILTGVSKSWAPLKALTVSIVAKLAYPPWDTRCHQKQIPGGLFSLRTIDKQYVSSELFSRGLYETPTEFALTRSFEKSEPFNDTYTGNISPKECKHSFLSLVRIINTGFDRKMCRAMLLYILKHLHERKQRTVRLINAATPISSTSLSLVRELLKGVFQSRELQSIPRIAEIVVHVACTVASKHLWLGSCVRPLRRHTAPDNHCNACADIEIEKLSDRSVFLVAEVKHLQINDDVIAVFRSKTQGVLYRYLLSTHELRERMEVGEIIVDSIESFVVQKLHDCLFHSMSVSTDYTNMLRQAILKDPCVDLGDKLSIQSFIKEL